MFAELRQLWRLALPLMGAQLAQMGMGVTDAIMAGRYGATDLAGVALGGSVMWPVMMLTMGLVQAVTPTVSQLHGAREFAEIGEVIRQGLWIALFGATLTVLLLNNVEGLYRWMQVEEAVIEIAVDYLQACSLGLPALMCFFCLRFLADGMGFTRPALLIAISALGMKIPLNAVLIHGLFGFPEMGGVGCGVAQAFIMWLQLGLILLVVTRSRFRMTGWMRRLSPPDWPRIRALLLIGVPIGTTVFAEMGLFAGTTLLLGRFGAEVVASHNIAMNLNGVLFMPPMAIGMAATIRIGHRIGGGETLAARSTALIAILGAALVAAFGSLLVFLLREQLVSLYTVDPAVVALASTLLLFVVFFLVLDAVQAACVGTLRGYKDTRVPMYIALFSYWVVGFPLECILGFGLLGEPLGVYGFWVGLSAGVGVAAVLLAARLWWLSGDEAGIRALAMGGRG